MQRRRFLSLGLAASLAAAQQKPTQKEEAVTAGATADESPRVGIVRSDFTGSEDHDGTQIPGLADLQPTDKELTDAQLEAMVRKALEIGSPRQGGLPSLVAPDDWVVIKPNIETCHGLGPETRDGGAHHPYIHGSVTDPRIVRTLIAFLLQNKCGRRFTIAEGSGQWLPKEKSKSLVDGWSTDWGGAYGGWSYRKMVEDFSVRYPGIRFELVDLNFDETVELPVPEGGLAKNNPGGTYHIPKTIQQCDRLISVAPLQTHSRTGAALSITNYLGIGPGSKYGFPKEGLHKLGTLDEVAVDLFSYHPAEYAILGGMWGLEGDGPHSPGAQSVRFNVIIAGANAVAVDAVGAAMMGLDLGRIQHLRLAERKGYGGWDLPLIWTRGNDVDESHRVFRPPAGWAAKG